MIAYCGLNCSQCDAYLATLEDSEVGRQATAEKWSRMYQTEIQPEQINCRGCKTEGTKFFHCSVCEIRQCCTTKGVEQCAACDQYVCETLAGFIKLAPEAGLALEKLRASPGSLYLPGPSLDQGRTGGNRSAGNHGERR